MATIFLREKPRIVILAMPASTIPYRHQTMRWGDLNVPAKFAIRRQSGSHRRFHTPPTQATRWSERMPPLPAINVIRTTSMPAYHRVVLSVIKAIIIWPPILLMRQEDFRRYARNVIR
jgi:hypothetical protein